MREEVGGVFAEAGEDIAGELGEWFSSLRDIVEQHDKPAQAASGVENITYLPS